MMKATIVISTFKRPQYLIKALRSLLGQDTKDYQIVVVNQDPYTEEQFIKFLTENKDTVRYIKSDTKGLAAGRNVGWRAANGEIIIFCDDDIIADRHFVKAHLDGYIDPEIGGVAGRVITQDDIPVSQIKQVGTLRRWDGKMVSNFNADFQTEVDHVWGCNMSFRKSLLEKIGGFDERLVGTSSFDDADLALAIKKLGYRVVFEPKALLKHVYAQNGGCRDLNQREKVYWYYHNFLIFFLKHLNRLFFPIFLLRQTAGIFRRAVKFKDKGIVYCGFKGLIRGFLDYVKKT